LHVDNDNQHFTRRLAEMFPRLNNALNNETIKHNMKYFTL